MAVLSPDAVDLKDACKCWYMFMGLENVFIMGVILFWYIQVSGCRNVAEIHILIHVLNNTFVFFIYLFFIFVLFTEIGQICVDLINSCGWKSVIIAYRT